MRLHIRLIPILVILSGTVFPNTSYADPVLTIDGVAARNLTSTPCPSPPGAFTPYTSCFTFDTGVYGQFTIDAFAGGPRLLIGDTLNLDVLTLTGIQVTPNNPQGMLRVEFSHLYDAAIGMAGNYFYGNRMGGFFASPTPTGDSITLEGEADLTAVGTFDSIRTLTATISTRQVFIEPSPPTTVSRLCNNSAPDCVETLRNIFQVSFLSPQPLFLTNSVDVCFARDLGTVQGCLNALESADVPEPASLWLLGSGLLGVFALGKRLGTLTER